MSPLTVISKSRPENVDWGSAASFNCEDLQLAIPVIILAPHYVLLLPFGFSSGFSLTR